jgi:hypothetical protein
VLPVLFAVLHVCDEPLRELLLAQLVELVVVVRQHIRRFLPDLLSILGEFWGRSIVIQKWCLKVRYVMFDSVLTSVALLAGPAEHSRGVLGAQHRHPEVVPEGALRYV